MRDCVVFYINDQRQVVRGEDAGLTLTDYLRNLQSSHSLQSPPSAPSIASISAINGISSESDSNVSGSLLTEGCQTERLVGTKVACAEGDCGACTVLVGKPDEANEQLVYETIDACIAFVYQMDRRHVVTVEGLQQEDKLADVQQAMVDCHGSQCGFCTPGFVMAMQGLVEENCSHANTTDDPAEELTEEQLRLGLSGNLCRCTGYSQILDAGFKTNVKNGYQLATRYDAKPIINDLSKLETGAVHLNEGASEGNTTGTEIYLPTTLDELTARVASHPEATVVSGATDLGVQFNHGRFLPKDLVTTSGIEELNRLEIVGDELLMGAAVPWSHLERFLEQKLPEFHDILIRFGSPQVRHAGTMGGNMANASPIADSLPWLYAAEATLELASVEGLRSVPIESFYQGYKQIDLQPNEVIATIRVPLAKQNDSLKLYKLSKRRDMDISTVTAAFWLSVEGDAIKTVRIALGGVGPTIIRAKQAEAALIGKPFELSAMKSAGKIARKEITPLSDVRGSDTYRLQVVENLFAKCYYDLTIEKKSTYRSAKG